MFVTSRCSVFGGFFIVVIFVLMKFLSGIFFVMVLVLFFKYFLCVGLYMGVYFEFIFFFSRVVGAYFLFFSYYGYLLFGGIVVVVFDFLVLGVLLYFENVRFEF